VPLIGEEIAELTVRDEAQQIVRTSLLYCLHHPVSHLSRLQRRNPRAYGLSLEAMKPSSLIILLDRALCSPNETPPSFALEGAGRTTRTLDLNELLSSK
jgi:hypothetical protein